MKYRVTYPLITTDGHRDFDTRAEAETFANEKRNNPGRFQTANSCTAARERDLDAFLAAYRRNPPPVTDEMRFEARAAHGPGVELVDVISGRRFTT